METKILIFLAGVVAYWAFKKWYKQLKINLKREVSKG